MPSTPTLLLALAAVATATAATGPSFVSIGDWGGASLEEEPKFTYKENTYAVAKQFAASAAAVSAEFVINLGDSFYWCGLENATDYQIQVRPPNGCIILSVHFVIVRARFDDTPLQ